MEIAMRTEQDLTFKINLHFKGLSKFSFLEASLENKIIQDSNEVLIR
jgi:hypothetical protein